MSTQILMPALSPTMEEGKLSKWLVKEGDTVKSGDILAEIETDKATMEFEAVDEGTIGKILVPEGTEGVKVNQPIAEMAGDDETAKAGCGSRSEVVEICTGLPLPPWRGSQNRAAILVGGGVAPRPSPKRQEALRRSIAVAISTLKGRVEWTCRKARR